ncbi:MAG TPA: thioredoxin [Deltaproteobacteria bacterium]|nr:thioredoxin [Deltaproteobacteria bacterium]
MNNNVIHATDENFNKVVIESGEPCLVDFWAPWCGPCRAIGPVLEEIANDYAGRVKVVKVNVDENPGLSRAYGVRSIPSLLFIHKGQVKDARLGAMPKAQLAAFIDRNLG